MSEEKMTKLKWWDWHKQNPAVYELFVKYTKEAINAGHEHYGAKGVIERIRWHTSVETGGDIFKINNNWAPFYARLFMVDYPEHDGFFRLRATEGCE